MQDLGRVVVAERLEGVQPLAQGVCEGLSADDVEAFLQSVQAILHVELVCAAIGVVAQAVQDELAAAISPLDLVLVIASVKLQGGGGVCANGPS